MLQIGCPIHQIPFPQHAPFPRFQLREEVGQEPQRVVRWEQGQPEKITDLPGRGYRVWGRYVVSDNEDTGPDFYAEHDVRTVFVPDDYEAASAAMKRGFIRLFDALDRVKRIG